MNLDFAAILVLATLVTGGIWLLDALFFARRRRVPEQASGDKRAAIREEPHPGAREPVIVEYARSFFPVILVVLLLRSFVVEPFRIPSGSMMPTLLVGDFILVNKFAYGLRWPVLNRKFLNLGEPQRGDVAVFRYPAAPSVDYIKRIVGVPGDLIDYQDKVLYVNGEPQAQKRVGGYTGVGSGTRETGSTEGAERIGVVEHPILVHPMAPDFAPGCRELAAGPLRVPPGQYFVMGDNRDNSNDSRCWGFVPEQNLVGKAFAIWMNWDMARNGFPIDWSRIGGKIP
jgi:signal peptidase I